MGDPFYSRKRRPLRDALPLIAVALLVVLIPLGLRAYDEYRRRNWLSNPENAATPTAQGQVAGLEPTIYDQPFGVAGCPPGAVDEASDASDARLTGSLSMIADAVAHIRHLSYKDPVVTRDLSTEQFKEKLRKSSVATTEKDKEFNRVYGRALELLRVIPDAETFQELITDVTTTQIAGFYDTVKKKVFVPGSVTDPSPLDEFVLAHELEHVLADQTLGIPRSESTEAISERDFAAQALTEGDAQLTSIYYGISEMSPEELAELGSDPSVQEAAEQEIPPVLERSINFPYTEGLAFVCYLVGREGWDAVDRAYKNPPQSTAEILFPERFGTSTVVDPPDPEPPAGWRLYELGTSGPFDLLTLFEAPDGEVLTQPKGAIDRVRRWNGGEIGIYKDGSGDVAVTLSAVDEPLFAGSSSIPHMCTQMKLWFSQNYADGQPLDIDEPDVLAREIGDDVALLRCSDSSPNVALAVAPDAKVASALADLKGP